jgi:hypothetical protein
MTSFIQKIAFLSFLIVGLNSCSKEVKIDIPGFDEQIVIDGSIETGTPAIIFLSNSKDISMLIVRMSICKIHLFK